MVAERKSRYDPKPVPYGEFGGPFIDPEEVERIMSDGDKEISLKDFFSEHGLTILGGHEVILSQVLGQLDQMNGFTTVEDRVFFKARNIGHVVSGFSLCNRVVLAEHFVAGKGSIEQVSRWLSDTVFQKELR